MKYIEKLTGFQSRIHVHEKTQHKNRRRKLPFKSHNAAIEIDGIEVLAQFNLFSNKNIVSWCINQ